MRNTTRLALSCAVIIANVAASPSTEPPLVSWVHDLYSCNYANSSGSERTLAHEESLGGVDLTQSKDIQYGNSDFMDVSFDSSSSLLGVKDSPNIEEVDLIIAASPKPPHTVAVGKNQNAVTSSGFRIGSKISDVVAKLGTTQVRSGSCGVTEYDYANPGCGNWTYFTVKDGAVVKILYTGLQQC